MKLRHKKGHSMAVLVVPKGTDKDWANKVARAKKARQLGAKIREGKPTSFGSTTRLYKS